jgi:superfamily II DNA or RNA helicase
MDSSQLHRLLADGDWQSYFDRRTLSRAAGYARERRVISLEHDTLAPQIEALTGAVRGTRPMPYLPAIELRANRGGLALRTQCTCPVGYDCKHAAALLIVAGRLAPADWPEVSDAMTDPLPVIGEHRPADDAPRSPAPVTLAAWERWLATLDEGTLDSVRKEVAPERRFGLLLRGDETGSLLANPVWLRPGKHRGRGLVDPQPLWLHGTAGPQPTPPGGWPPAIPAALVLLMQNRYVHIAGKYWSSIEAEYQETALETLLNNYPTYFEKGSVPIERGEALALETSWQNRDDGSQRLRTQIKGHPDALLLRGASLWYILPKAHRYGHVEGDPRLVSHVRSAPPVQPEEVPALSRRLARPDAPIAIPAPAKRDPIRPLTATPAPRLTLRAADMRWNTRKRAEHSLACAHLSFDYAGHDLAPANYEEATRMVDAGQVFEIRRDQRAEDQALDRLEEMGWVDAEMFAFDRTARRASLGQDDFFLRPNRREPPLGPQAARPFLETLAEEGFLLDYEEGFPHAELVPIEGWHAELGGGENAWFEVSLGIDVGGERVDLLPVLRRVLADPKFPLAAPKQEPADALWRVEIDAERMVEMSRSRLRALIAPLVEWIEGGADESRVHVSRAPALADAASGAGLAWRGGERLRERLALLSDAPRSVNPPPGFKATLRPYQREGLAWLDLLAAGGLGGILADDMGLGKTVQMLAHILGEKQRGRLADPALVIAPTSLVGNWQAEAARFAPDLKVLILHGADRSARFKNIPGHDLVITTYPLLPRDSERLKKRNFSLLVLDEAQAIKNARSQAARVVRELKAERRLAMTGTPLENHLGELWAQFDAVEPGLLGSERQFRRLYRTPIEKHNDGERRERLRRRIAPLILRRRKDDVLAELPPKTEIPRTLELAKAQRGLYETLRLAQHKRVREAVRQRGFAQSGIVVLDALLKLRQVCCDPRLVKLENARRVSESAKLDALLELLDGLLDENRRVLVFSQFTEMLGLIEAALEKRKIEYLMLTGQTPGGARAKLIERFQTGTAPVFLVSLKAGGVGLNLTAADAVVHYDPWWNPAVEAQATDRAHRIGQDKPVFVYKLICAGTVEEKIQALQGRKAGLAQAMLEGGESAKLRFSESDLAELFAPL